MEPIVAENTLRNILTAIIYGVLWGTIAYGILLVIDAIGANIKDDTKRNIALIVALVAIFLYLI